MSLVQFTTQQTYPSSLLHIILMFFYGISLLFTGNIPRGVFCEQSSQKTRELSLRSKRYFLCLSQEGSSFCASRSVLLVTE